MTGVWFALKKSLQCNSEPADVHEPKVNEKARSLGSISTRKISRSGCSRSIANLRDVIHGSKRHFEKPTICSPRSIGSSELVNPITHQVVLDSSTSELKIIGNGFPDCNSFNSCEKNGSQFECILKPKPKVIGSPIRRSSSSLSRRVSGFGSVSARSSRHSFGVDSLGIPPLICSKCSEQFTKWESAEEHHLSKHAVTELLEGDSSRKIVELICRPSWAKSSEKEEGGVERILKVHNMQKTLAQFEEYREMVKIKASKLAKKHPRCLADGNELLRFHGTTVLCGLESNASSCLCTNHKCNVCRILRHGFSTKEEASNGRIGVFTASSSSRALESIVLDENGASPSAKKAMIVCRVIAGRVHKPLENVQELVGQSGFDSLAGKVGVYLNIEELYLLNARALLPCFIVICK